MTVIQFMLKNKTIMTRDIFSFNIEKKVKRKNTKSNFTQLLSINIYKFINLKAIV